MGRTATGVIEDNDLIHIISPEHGSLDEIQVNNVTKDQVREIATEVLAATNQITEMTQIDPVLNALAAKYKVLVPAQVKQMVYEEEQIRSKAASELTNLLKQGKLEEAGDLATKYLGDK